MRWFAILALAGCSSTPAEPARITAAIVPAAVNQDVDVLFLIDDSTNSIEAQNDVKSNFPAFRAVLEANGMPNLHIGVATSDLGTTAVADAMPGPSIGTGAGSCSGVGRAGALQNQGTTVTGNYISDASSGSGSGRTTNYSGTLDDAFTSIASVGATGCGFEQHLEAITRALDNNAANTGFLRPDANLAVVIVADEDDCSLEHTSLIDQTNDALGPLASFRCTHYGVTCDDGGATPDAMNTPGGKERCHSNEQSPYLTHVADHAAFLRGLKPDPTMVMVGTLVGPKAPVTIELRALVGSMTPLPALAHTCSSPPDALSADPAIRIDELASQLDRHIVGSICPMDLQPQLTTLAREIESMTGSPCLPRDIAMPADCVVTDDAGAVTDYQLVEDAATCPDGQHVRLVLGGATHGATVVKCTAP